MQNKSLNVFMAIPFAATSSGVGDRIWYRNLYESVVELGHHVVLFPLEPARMNQPLGTDAFRDSFEKSLSEFFDTEARKTQFDVFFGYFNSNWVSRAFVDRIGARVGVTMNFSCDNLHGFGDVKDIATAFDLNLHSEKAATGLYEGVGAKSYWFPMAANPKYYYPVDTARDIDISFVGRKLESRATYLNYLFSHNVDTNIYGAGWNELCRKRSRVLLSNFKRKVKNITQGGNHSSSALLPSSLIKKYASNWYGFIDDEELNKLFNRSFISLGFSQTPHSQKNNGQPNNEGYVRLRDFEVPMAGSLGVLEHSPEIEMFYEPDKEIVTFSNPEELLEKANLLLNDRETAETIRAAGHRRARDCHTYQKRFKDLFEWIG
jgi:hypothetical protein